MKVLANEFNPDQVRVLASAIVESLGKVKPTGVPEIVQRTNTFDTQQFLKNWLQITPEAKSALFNKTTDLQSLKNSLDKIANVATRFEGANPFENLGQTAKRTFAGSGLLIAAAAGGLGGLTTGTAVGALSFIAAVPVFGAGSAVAYKALSNPKFMEWLAKSTSIAENKGFEGWAKHLTGLGVIAANSDGDVRTLTEQNLKILSKAGENVEKIQSQQKQTPVAPSSIMQPVNTRITEPRSAVPTTTPVSSRPTSTGPSGGITSIPPERLQAAQLLFGRV